MNTNEIILNYIHKTDDDFFVSLKRKNEGWIVKEWITRKVYFKSNFLTIRIRKYCKFVNNKWQYYNVLSDTLHKYKHIDTEIEKEITKIYLNGLTYRKIANIYSLHHTTIFNIVRKNYHQDIKLDNLKKYNVESESKNTIYISMDDTYFKAKKERNHITKIKARMINFFLLDESKKPICKNHLIILSSPKNNWTINALVKKILFIIRFFYSNKLKIVISGDGAKWIRSLANKLKAKYILCKYHLKSKFNVIFNNSNHLKYELNQLQQKININLKDVIIDNLRNNNYRFILNFIINNWNDIYNAFDEKRAKLLYEFTNYIKSNLKGLEEITKDDLIYYGNTAESYVSHLIKSRINQDYSIFSLKTIIQKIVNPFNYSQNNIQIELINL